MAGEEGFEPPNAGTRTQCLTTWRLPNDEVIDLVFQWRPLSPFRSLGEGGWRLPNSVLDGLYRTFCRC